MLELRPDPESDLEDRERMIRGLRAELAELDVGALRYAPGAAPPDGAKSADPGTIDAIIVAMSASGGVFTAVIETVKDWLGRQAARHRLVMTVDGDTIELARASREERQALVDAFVRRHSAG